MQYIDTRNVDSYLNELAEDRREQMLVKRLPPNYKQNIKVKCECGRLIVRHHITIHRRTNIHNTLMSFK